MKPLSIAAARARAPEHDVAQIVAKLDAATPLQARSVVLSLVTAMRDRAVAATGERLSQRPAVDAATYADAVAERVAELLAREQQLTPVLVDVAGAARLLED